MVFEIFKNIILNISLLTMIAFLLTRIRLVKEFITLNRDKLPIQLALCVIFGLIGILSTYTGIGVNGAIANTRVVGVLAGGLLGGPIVGAGAGLIAGVHRCLIDIGGFTAAACAISTIVEGMIGGYFSKRLKRLDDKWGGAFVVAALAEFIQMGIILLIARPFEDAWVLVKTISLPMILFNSLGTAIFIGIFDSVFIEQDREASNRVRRVLEIADRCLPYLRKGLYDRQNLGEAVRIIHDLSSVSGVVITDRTEILGMAGGALGGLGLSAPLPALIQKTLCTGEVQLSEEADPEDPFSDPLKKLTAVCAPLTQRGEVIGTLTMFIRKFKLTREVECEFVGGLARLFSTQIELSQLEYQKKLLQKAEFAALQSQINPHFLFNALNTITSFCREKPERARELLIVLSSYFRRTLQTGKVMISLCEELNHVNAYLELEKARFEEKLQIETDVPEGLDCTVPSFILQPTVENAVRHGARNVTGVGRIAIRARQRQGETVISVNDNGPGIRREIVERVYSGTMDENHVGLSNIQKRLKSIYGEDRGLIIDTSPAGTTVVIRIPNQPDRRNER